MITCRNGCGREYTGTAKDINSWECSICVMEKIEEMGNSLPETVETPERKMARPHKKEVRYVKGKPGFPIGWHRRKKFTHPNGTIYERGVAVS